MKLEFQKIAFLFKKKIHIFYNLLRLIQTYVINIWKLIKILKKQRSDLNQASCRRKTKNIEDLDYVKQWNKESESNVSDCNPNNQSCSINDLIRKQNEIPMILATTQARSMLPLTEPDVFDVSDILNYKSFISFDKL